jgi:uncharacterized protein YjbJ (UPF0337 family)
MNWDRIEGKWDEFKGTVRTKWAKLTDDDFTALRGKRDQLSGAIQHRYGVMKDDAERQIDEWLNKLDGDKNRKPTGELRDSRP